MKIEKIKAFNHYVLIDFDQQAMANAIASQPLIPIQSDQSFASGFTPVLPQEVCADLSLDVHGKLFFKYTLQSKSYPMSAFKQKCDHLTEQYRLEHGVASELPEEIVEKIETDVRKTMLEFAPIKTRHTTGYIDPLNKRVVFFTASPGQCEEVISFLIRIRPTPDAFRARVRDKEPALKSMFTHWVRQLEAAAPCGLNERLCIKYPNKGKATIQKRHIANMEVAQLIQDGEVCEVGLSLIFENEIADAPHLIEFAWDENGIFKSLNYLNLYQSIWENTLALDELIQAKKLFSLSIAVVDTLILASETMLEGREEILKAA